MVLHIGNNRSNVISAETVYYNGGLIRRLPVCLRRRRGVAKIHRDLAQREIRTEERAALVDSL